MLPLPGASVITYFRYYDYFFFAQDEFRIKPNLTITYGIRYESPGNALQNLADANQNVVAAFNGDERYRYTPVPARDMNNWAPRFGINYRFGQGPGALGWLTGDKKLVIRAGYSRTYDVAFNNIALNVGTAFPFRLVVDIPLDPSVPGLRPNAFTIMDQVRKGNVPAAGQSKPGYTHHYFEGFSGSVGRAGLDTIPTGIKGQLCSIRGLRWD